MGQKTGPWPPVIEKWFLCLLSVEYGDRTCDLWTRGQSLYPWHYQLYHEARLGRSIIIIPISQTISESIIINAIWQIILSIVAWYKFKCSLRNMQLQWAHKKMILHTLSGRTGSALVWHSEVARSRLTQCSESCDLQPALQCAIRGAQGVLPCVGWGVRPVKWIYRLWRHCP